MSKAFYPYYGLPMYYMVLSNRRLRDAELLPDQQRPRRPGMIKIRYNKKNYERLLSIVPSRIALSLQAQFKDIPPKRFNFASERGAGTAGGQEEKLDPVHSRSRQRRHNKTKEPGGNDMKARYPSYMKHSRIWKFILLGL